MVSNSKLRVKLIATQVSLDRKPVGPHRGATKLYVPVYDTYENAEDTS